MAHELRHHEGLAQPSRTQPKPVQRPFWYCTCSRFVGGDGVGWVCYITQARPKGGGGGKPDRQEAERLHRRHIEDVHISEEAW